MTDVVCELRYPMLHSGLLLVVGGLLVLTATANGNAGTATVGLLVAAMGGLFMQRPWVVVREGAVEVRSPFGPTLHRYPISGLRDLAVVDGQLHGPAGPLSAVEPARTRSEDWAKLVALIEAASVSPPPA